MIKIAKNTVHNELVAMEPGDISYMIDSLMTLNALGKCQTNEEVKDRIQMYFDFCRERSFRPGVEGLATALSVHRNTLWHWSKGKNCDAERTEIVNNALQLIYSFLEQCGLSGRISPPSYIFLSKVWMKYRETAPVNEAVETTPELSKTELMSRLGIDDTLLDDIEVKDYDI